MPESTIEERAVKLLDLIAGEMRPCAKCGTKLWFVTHKNGRRAPYTADLTNHFINCPNAEEFRRRLPTPTPKAISD